MNHPVTKGYTAGSWVRHFKQNLDCGTETSDQGPSLVETVDFVQFNLDRCNYGILDLQKAHHDKYRQKKKQIKNHCDTFSQNESREVREDQKIRELSSWEGMKKLGSGTTSTNYVTCNPKERVENLVLYRPLCVL